VEEEQGDKVLSIELNNNIVKRGIKGDYTVFLLNIHYGNAY